MSPLRRRLVSAHQSERGAVLILAAFGMVVAVFSASLAVDLGSRAQEARQNQKVADLASLDGVRTMSDLVPDPKLAAMRSAVRNGFDCPDLDVSDGCGLTVQWLDSSTGDFTDNPLLLLLPTRPTAVRVTAMSPHENDFTSGRRIMSRTSTAALGNGAGCTLPDVCVVSDGAPIGTVRVGSTLASIDSTQAVILNRVLTQVVGGSYSLNAVGWQGIADGNVQFSKLKAALGYEAGTVDSLGNATFTFRQLLDATVSAMNQNGESAANVNAANRLLTIASQVGVAAGALIRFGDFFDVVGNVGNGVDVADARINALDIVRSGLVLADSNNFAELTLVNGDLPAPITDLIDIKVKLGLIEAPQMKSGPDKLLPSTYRTVATTSQVRLLVEVKLNLDLGLAARVEVTIPYYIDAGTAQAKLDKINCSVGQAQPTSVVIVGETQAISANIGSVGNAALGGSATPVAGVATLADMSVTSLTRVRITTTTATSLSVPGTTATRTFNPPYASDNPPQTIPGTQLVSLPVLGGATTVTEVLVGEVLDVGLSAGVETALLNAVAGRSTGILNNVITPAMRALGLSLGAAALWAPPPQNCNPTSFNTDPGGGPPPTIPTLSS